MFISLAIAVAVIIAALAFVFYLINQKIGQLKDLQKNDQTVLMLQNQLNELSRTMSSGLAQTHQAVQTQVGASAKIVQDVTEKLTKVVTISEQLQGLEDILKNPKQRGILGEYYLEMVLKNVLPPTAYQVQYKFKDGEIVDAVIFLGDQIIPIDSKFSLENYNKIAEERNPAEREKLEKLFKQDLKNRIDETAKYIRPEEGTIDYAFMFIPAEAIYYDLLVNQVGAMKINTRDLIEYANHEKHVVIVSPTTFHVYLQLVTEGLNRMKIGESVKEIVKRVGDLGKHLNAYDDYLKKLGGHLGTTVNTYNLAYNEFKKVDKDVVKIAGGESQIEPLQIDKPRVE